MKKRTKFADSIDPESDEFKVGEWPFYAVARLAGRYHLRLDAVLKPIKMDVARWRVLMILATGRGATVTEISTEAVTKISTTAKIIQRMVLQNLVKTKTSAEDARSIEVSITPEGLRILQLIRSKIGKVSKEAFANLSESELRELNKVAGKIFDNLSN